MRQFAKDLEAGINFFAGEGLQAFGTKTLHRKRSHHPAVEESPLQDFAVQLFLRGDVSHESAGERVTRAGWIFDFFDGQSRCAKGWRPMPNAPSRKKIVAPYSPCLMTSACGPMARTFWAARSRLGSPASILTSASLIRQYVDQLQGFDQVRTRALDPVIHGVAAGETNSVHLLPHRGLQSGMDIAKKQEFRVRVFGGIRG